MSIADQLLEAARVLRDDLQLLKFRPPVTHVYNPLVYAWPAYEKYIRTYANSSRRILFLGMNPGPFGMVQTGVPFGEIAAVRDWLGIQAKIGAPDNMNPKRPVTGFECKRSEISGRRLWGLFSEKFKSPRAFFEEHIVMNYCPLAFMESSGRNLTPDKLPGTAKEKVLKSCDLHLQAVVGILRPEWIIGVGGFAFQRARDVLEADFPQVRLGQVLHPSPACPAANRDWPGVVQEQMRAQGIWR